MVLRSLLVLSAAVLVSSCVDHNGNPMNPFGPATPPAYSDQREQYRSASRDASQQQNQLAYERGISDARADASAGLPQSTVRHFQSYSPATRAAYEAGYQQGYQPQLAPLPGASMPWQQEPEPPSPYFGRGSLNPPQVNPAPVTGDPAYNQGYDYGLRDRVAGRPNDPAAHTGRYDPRFRRSFERGYVDAYGSRR